MPSESTSATLDRFDALRLVGASFQALFVELALLRFLPAHVRVVGYFTNLVLIASFLGLGCGFLVSARGPSRAGRWFLPALIATVLAVRFLTHVVVAPEDAKGEALWLFDYGSDHHAVLPLPVIVLTLFGLTGLTLAPVGVAMGDLFERFPRTTAYALDLGGSLLGVLAFGALSAMGTPPLLWFAIVGVLAVLVLLRTRLERAAGALLAVALLTVVASLRQPGEIWSPYYKVTLEHHDERVVLRTNDTLHQVMLDFDSDSEYVARTRSRFEIPYRMAGSLDRVLVVGAGTGNDLAIALRMGAKHVDAVEIDPTFPRIGRAEHPQHPYDDPRVELHVTDARAWFRAPHEPYDLIVFGTLDSQALLSGFSSVRLDNFVYTRESIADAFSLLGDDGLLAVFHMSLNQRIAMRIFRLLEEATGEEPFTQVWSDYTLFNRVFVAGRRAPRQHIEPEVRAELDSMLVPSDDWPFLYVDHREVPRMYRPALGGILAMALASVWLANGRRRFRFDGPLFFLGAGFLLLETRSVTQLSLLFGSTWVVNLLVFSSILGVALVANVWVARHPGIESRMGRVTLLLVATLVALSFLPIVPWLASLPGALSWAGGALVVGLPVGLAGVLFPTLFRAAHDARAAFASNLLGAIVGGVAEYGVMALGIRSLGLVAALFYLLALAAWTRRA